MFCYEYSYDKFMSVLVVKQHNCTDLNLPAAPMSKIFALLRQAAGFALAIAVQDMKSLFRGLTHG